MFIGVFPFIIGTKEASGDWHFSLHKYIGLVVIVSILWILFLIRLLVYKKSISGITFAEKILLVFIGILIVSTLFSVDITTSLYGTRKRYEGLSAWMCYLSLFFFTYHFLEKRNYKKLAIIILAGATISAIYGIIQHYFPSWVDYHSTRSESFYDNPNFFGSYLVLMILFTSTLYVVVNQRTKVITLLLINCLLFTSLILSMTRSGWLGVGVGLLLFSFIVVWKRREMWKRWTLLFLTFVSIFLTIQITSQIDYYNRAQSIIEEGATLLTTEDSNGGSGRVLIWKHTLPLIKDYFWIGSGPDTLMHVFPQEIWQKYQPNLYVDKAHNEFLQMAVTMGIPALIIYLTFIGYILYKGFFTVSPIHGKNQIVIYGLLTIVIGYLAQAFFNISVIPVKPFYWVMLAILLKQLSESEVYEKNKTQFYV